MLKITPIRAKLGKSVSAKLKNTKDDSERVIEFKLSEFSLTMQQLADLVACSKHERPFDQVAFVSKDAVSELRKFKKLTLATEVHHASMTIELLGTRGNKVSLAGCSLKSIGMTFDSNEACEIDCTVWAPLAEHALYRLSEWGSQDVTVTVLSANHGDEEPSAQKDIDDD